MNRNNASKVLKDQTTGLTEEIRICSNSFDSDFYRETNPDLSFFTFSEVEHFCEVGWIEGRSPAPSFDVAVYFSDNPDVSEAHVNPLYHYLLKGSSEGRRATDANVVSVRIAGWNTKLRDRVFASLRLLIERESYIEKNDLGWAANPKRLNLPMHWLNRGLENEIPLNRDLSEVGRSYCKSALREVYDEMDSQDRLAVAIEKLLAKLDSEPRIDIQVTEIEYGNLSDHEHFLVATIAPEFDASFYKLSNGDLDFNNLSPLLHFSFHGWKEGRNPNAVFDCAFYLSANLDVKDADLNPFYHYLVAGRAEGRVWQKRGGLKRTIIEAVLPPEKRPFAKADDSASTLAPSSAILAELKKNLTPGRRLAFSVSHDCYVKNVGGTQIFLSDEQKKLNQDGYCYIHVAPAEARLHLLHGVKDYRILLTIDGTYLYQTTMARLIQAFSNLDCEEIVSIGIVHCILGHETTFVARAFETLKVSRSLFWVHDYSSLCLGFNLLRDDVEFCGVLKPTSMACRVCIYGESRAAHLERIKMFLERIDPIVVAPSMAALEIWAAEAPYVPEFQVVAPHIELSWKNSEIERFRHFSGTGADPIVVAFIGYPALHKGWHTFLKLVSVVAGDPRFKLIHFGKSNTHTDGVAFVPLEVTREDRLSAIRTLVEHQVDIVVNAAAWPETFSFVTFEAAAAGAMVFTTPVSGNVARAVDEFKFGKVFEDDQTLIDFFGSGRVIGYLRENALLRERSANFDIVGTTSAVLAEIHAI